MISFVWIHKTFGLTSSNRTVTKNRTVTSSLRCEKWKEDYKLYQKAQRIVFTKASALPLQTVPFRSSFKTVYVFVENRVLRISVLQVCGKNRNRFELPHSVWTNPVYKTSWASLPAKQANYSWFQFRFNVKLLHDWSNFDLPKLMPVEHVSLMPSSCLYARIHANKLLITTQPIRNLWTLASTEMNKRGFL